ncbi:hypothetical protein ABZS98_27920 [Streptomyces avermitilis]|uniref:hypothetical protein n=1 Tax=Streptomyces avermitilis TaxID=33903 RepID=UPI0033BEDA48
MVSLEREIHELNAPLHEFSLLHREEIAGHFGEDCPGTKEISRRNLPWHGEFLPVPPALLPTRAVERMSACHSALHRALDHLFDRRLNSSWRHLATALRLEETILRFVDTSRRPNWLTICRPDVVLSGDAVSIVEPNAGTSCGFVSEADVLGRLFEAAPAIGDYLQAVGARRDDAVAALAAHLLRRLRQAGEPVSALILVMDFAADLQAYAGGYELMASELRRYGLRAEVAAVEDLEVGPSGVFHGGERCALLYRYAGEEPDPTDKFKLLAPLLDAARAGHVVIADELQDAIAANKTILAPLSEELDAGRLPRDLTDTLATFIPWTRVLEEARTNVDGALVDLPAWALAHRSELVLKPGSGFCGRGVTVGSEVDDTTWSKALDAALEASEAWIVQRLVVSHPTRSAIVRDSQLLSEESYVDYGYFAVDGSVPAVIRKNAPFGSKTRRVKLASVGPVFLV